MSKRFIGVTLLAAVTALALAAAVLAQVQRVPAQRLPNVDGPQAYAAYCASCHGEDGKGNAKAAQALKEPVPDLTTIAIRHGKFDPARVLESIKGSSPEDKREMPHWNYVLSTTYRSTSADHLILHNLVQHLETMQAKTK